MQESEGNTRPPVLNVNDLLRRLGVGAHPPPARTTTTTTTIPLPHARVAPGHHHHHTHHGHRGHRSRLTGPQVEDEHEQKGDGESTDETAKVRVSCIISGFFEFVFHNLLSNNSASLVLIVNFSVVCQYFSVSFSWFVALPIIQLLFQLVTFGLISGFFVVLSC